MFHEAERLLGPGRYLMVGDRLDADVAGAHAAGMDAALVLTGSSSAADAASFEGPAPVAVLGSIAELPALALAAPTCTGT
jgi:ribonucleotide monophosphatase NagD (HAD superfamily)